MPTAGSSLCLAQPGRDRAVTGDKHGYCTHHRPLMSAVSRRGWPRYRFLKQQPLALYVITLHSVHGSQNCRTVASSFISGQPRLFKLESPRTVHTSAKARPTSVAIYGSGCGSPPKFNHLSIAHCQPSLKISCKSVRTFLRKVANGQTNRQTNKQR